MRDENPIRTLGDYSKPSPEGYRNTIELPEGNNMVPLRSDTIRLVQNGCSFHGLRSEDPNQHLKDFHKLVDSLDLDAGSISIWEDLTTRFVAQLFPPGRTAKLRNDILMFQQHLSLSEAWTRFKDLLQKVPHHGIDLWLKLRDRNPEESWAILEDLALYDNESWNNPRDFAKPVKAIALPQDVPSTSDRRLIELENQVQRLMEAHLAPTQPTQVNKITTSCEICSGPHDTQNCMENPEQAFVEYASSRTDEAGEGLVSEFMASQDARLSKFETDFKQQQSEMTNKIDIVLKAITERIAGTLPSDTIKNLKLGTHPVLSAQGNLRNTDSKQQLQPNQFASITTEQDDGEVMFIEIIRDDEPQNKDPNEGEEEMTEEPVVEYFDTFPTRNELTYHRKDANGGFSNFMGRIKGMHVFMGNFTYVIDFMIVEDISSIIDPRFSQVVLGRPFIKISNMTHDPPEGVVRFIRGVDEVSYKMPHKIEQYNSLSDLEKEHTKSVYLRNEEDKRRGVEYVMSKILRFYNECLELGPEYLTGMDDDGEVT
ncbi:MAK10-like protein [Tanacetum coccineum]